MDKNDWLCSLHELAHGRVAPTSLEGWQVRVHAGDVHRHLGETLAAIVIIPTVFKK